MKSDMIKIQAMRAVVGGKGIVAPSIASVVKIFQTEKLVVPETKLTQPGKGGTQDRRVSILTQSPNVMDPLGRTSGTAQSTKIDSRTLEPELVVSHGFYVGTSLGEAIIIQIDVGASKNISLTINARRRTSILPIRTVCVAEFQNAVISVVSHTATDKYVAAHSLKLECIWQCKIEFLNGSVRDHLTRKINQAELENFNLQGIEGVTGNEQYLDKTGQPVEAESDHHVSALQLDDFIITSVCPDRFNKRILVALKSGNILTISAPFAVAETNSHRLIPIVPGARNNKETSIQLHTMPSMSEFGSKGNLGPTGRLMSPPKTAGIISAAGSTTNLTAIQPITGGVLSMADLTKSRIASAASRSDSARGMRKSFVQKSEEAVAEQLAASKDIFVSWLMDAYCVESFLDAIAKEKDENAKNDSDDPNLLFMQPNSPKPPVFIPISSISVFTNNTLQKDQLLITCPDGSVRVHTLDEGGSVTSVFPDLLQISDPESRTSLGTVCPSRVHRIDAVAAFCRSRQGCQLIASFSLDGTLSIMDVDENTVLLDMLIPSNRRIEKISAAGTALAATARLRAGSILGSLPSPRNRGLIAESTTDTAKHKAEKKTQKYGISVVNAEKGLYVIWAGRDWSVMTMKQLISWKLKNIARNRENSLILSTLESNEAENDVQSVPHFVIN
ncbi:hypothetical protein BC830DRAFT_503741 [Chytriomyces sp. MP71]|nr:hypothetical protein BC830DRAFT_503741 [Chytriomyces sp. MP71]